MSEAKDTTYKNNPEHEGYYKVADSIREKRRHAMNGHRDVASDIQNLILKFGFDEARLFAQQLGMTDREFELYRNFPSEESELWNVLRNTWAGPDTLKTLVAADGAVLYQALAALKAKTSLEDGRLKQIQAENETAELGQDQARDRFRSDCFAAAANRIGETRLGQMKSAAAELFQLLKVFQEESDAIAQGNRWWLNWHAEGEDDDTYLRSAEEWELTRATLVRNLEMKRPEISLKSAPVLALFNELFPDSYVPVEDWAKVGEADFSRRRLAECLHALNMLERAQFDTTLPFIQSRYHHWSCLSSIAFLAGVSHDFALPERRAPRPLRKLNALVLSETAGVGALGISEANCFVTAVGCRDEQNVQSIRANRMDWNANALELDSAKLLSAASTYEVSGRSKAFQIVAGSLPGHAFQHKAKKFREKEPLSQALMILDQVKPGGFFLECVADLMAPRFTNFVHEIRWQLQKMGFTSALIQVNAADYGVPQDRPRAVLIGVRSEHAERLRMPVLRQPIPTVVGQFVVDLAFPYLPTLDRSYCYESRKRYYQWAYKWLNSHGAMATVPDSMSILKTTDDHEKWATANGFNLNSDGILQPAKDLSTVRLVPLSVAILKRLHGIPDEWELVGTYDEQIEQIVHSMPPVVARVLAQTLHQAITGETVDLDLVAREQICGLKRRGPSRLRVGHSDQWDPKAYAASEWRNFVLNQDTRSVYVHDYWASAPEVHADPSASLPENVTYRGLVPRLRIPKRVVVDS